MSEQLLLYVFLLIAFVMAPLMTKRFFLNESRAYSDAHKVSLAVLFLGWTLNLPLMAAVWPLFCAFGLVLFLKQGKFLFSATKLAELIPFLFSLISAIWFFAGVNDLHLLGYNRAWSFYAALHGSFLGWMFTGCLAFLSRRQNSKRLYMWGCFFSFVFFLFVAFGIDGTPYIKRTGLTGFSLLVPLLIARYLFDLNKSQRRSKNLAVISLLAIVVAMVFAVANEFRAGAPWVIFDIPVMVLTHGFLNAIVTIPCFYLAIRAEESEKIKSATVTDNVVFFDDFCVLCSGTVKVLIGLDKKRLLKYSSLQGEFARKVLKSPSVKTGESVIFLSDNFTFERSEAAIKILLKLGGAYRLLGLLLNLFPLFLLNLIYDFVARNRYSFFGKNDSCLIPKEEERILFLP